MNVIIVSMYELNGSKIVWMLIISQAYKWIAYYLWWSFIFGRSIYYTEHKYINSLELTTTHKLHFFLYFKKSINSFYRYSVRYDLDTHTTEYIIEFLLALLLFYTPIIHWTH